jgi:hypothetical protein
MTITGHLTFPENKYNYEIYMEMYLLVEFDIFQHLYGLIVVTKKGMES